MLTDRLFEQTPKQRTALMILARAARHARERERQAAEEAERFEEALRDLGAMEPSRVA
jgi:uncharacterized protein YjiS (DUF1127 family)